MSTDPSAAIGRIDAAVEESSPSTGASPRELADLAAVIERIESLIADGTVQSPEGAAAAERISDIALTLHEHEVEASLSHTLDAAVREINNVGAVKDGSIERRQQLAELLRQLSRRVHDMVAQSKANQRSESPSGTNAARTSNPARHSLLDEGDGEDDAIGDSAFKTDVPEDDEFALVVAALTASLPSLAEFGAPVPIPPAALAEDVTQLPDGTLLPELSAELADEAKADEGKIALPQPESSEDTVVIIESSSAVLLDEPVSPQVPSSERAAGKDLAAGEPLALGEDFLRDLVPGDQSADAPPADAVQSSDAPSEDSLPHALLGLPAPKAPADSTHEASDESSGDLAAEELHVAAVVDPAAVDAARPSSEDASPGTSLPLIAADDDPGDLFEAMIPAPSIALQAAEKGPELVLPEPEPQTLPLPEPSLQSRVAAAARVPPQPALRPASNNPLGPVRALSEEETIALFS